MHSPREAFTRVELVACLGAVALLATIATPLIANTPAASTRAVCSNNLRLLGGALQRWASDHTDHVVWFTRQQDGGSFPSGPKTGTAWVEFSYLSNELAAPRILVCPQDRSAKLADNFTSGAGGFANSGFRGNALSYSVFFDSDLVRPRSVLASDYDFTCAPGTVSCSRGGTGVRSVSSTPFPDGTALWTNLVHQHFGNVLFADEHVESVPNAQFKTILVTGDDNGSVHFVPPR